MFLKSPEAIELKVPYYPYMTGSNFRQFNYGEKHVDRINNEYVLIFMFKNKLYFSEAGEEVEVSDGEWYIQVPGLLQQGNKASDEAYYYFIHFIADGEAISVQSAELMKKNLSNRSSIISKRGKFEKNRVKSFFEQIEALKKEEGSNNLCIQAVFLNILNTLVKREWEKTNQSKELAKTVMRYVNENYFKEVVIEEIAKELHFSKDYITRTIKKHLGVTPIQLLTKKRIDVSKELLSNTDYTIEIISKEVGYSDLSVFYKAFKKNVGEAPGVWRNKIRGI